MTNNKDRIAYLNTIAKSPLDLLLEIIEIDCYKYDFISLDIYTIDRKSIKNILFEEYNIDINEYTLKKWISSFFVLESKKLKLKKTEEKLETKITNSKIGQIKFLEQIANVRDLFIKYSQDEFNIKIDKELAKEIFDNYLYTVSAENNLNLEGDNAKFYYIFQCFLKKLYNSDRENLSLIENFGIANQIQNIVIFSAEVDKHFLTDCVVFLDTPILMKVLGYDGMELATSYRDFIGDLKKAGAKIKIFEHTFEELWSILFNFKRCIAQGIFDGKGVMTFLNARKEFLESTNKKELPLDKDLVRDDIDAMGFEIIDISEIDNLKNKDNYTDWDIDVSILKECLIKADPSYQRYESRLSKDCQSIISVFRLRKISEISDPRNFRDGKYYLLVDNFALITALKDYYRKTNDKKTINELLLESSIVFDLWQNLSGKDDLNRSLFRSKCFALNTIDEKFKEVLYRETRKLEIYNSEIKIDHQLISRPDIEGLVYSASIRDNRLDGEYLSKTLLNVIDEKERKLKEKIQMQENEKEQIISQVEKANKDYETQLKRQLSEQETELNNYKLALIEKKVFEISNTIWFRIIIFIKGFKKDFNKNKYLWEKACSILGVEFEYNENIIGVKNNK